MISRQGHMVAASVTPRLQCHSISVVGSKANPPLSGGRLYPRSSADVLRYLSVHLSKRGFPDDIARVAVLNADETFQPASNKLLL